MRYLSEYFRRNVSWRLDDLGSKCDDYFRGKAEVIATDRPTIYNKPLDDWQIQTLAMCPSGGSVYVDLLQNFGEFEISHADKIEKGYKNLIQLRQDTSGVYLYIDLVLFDAADIEGFGATAFLRAAQMASRLGFSRIDMLAAGGRGYTRQWTRKYNGYYTWPRFGFNAPLQSPILSLIQGTAKFAGCLTVLDVVGRDPSWWQDHGDGCEMTFELQSNSRSWHTLYTYLNEKRGLK
jgi:hypothetical protein